MKPITLLQTAIRPALSELETFGIKTGVQAERFLLAIALQESGLRYRRQVVSGGIEDGPASSFWQFEKNGGCKGVLSHRLTAAPIKAICSAYNVAPDAQSLWEAMRYQDIVAACAARLLVYTLPGSLPDNSSQGWAQYIDAWRPGKPHPETWAANWKLASETVGVA